MAIELDIDRDRMTKEILVQKAQLRESIEKFLLKCQEFGINTQITAGTSGLFEGVEILAYDKNTHNEL